MCCSEWATVHWIQAQIIPTEYYSQHDFNNRSKNIEKQKQKKNKTLCTAYTIHEYESIKNWMKMEQKYWNHYY